MEFRTHLRRCLRQASLDLRVRGVASWVRWTAVVVVLLGGAAELRGGGTPVGTLITSSASVSYSHPSGTTGNKTSADVMVMMGQVAGVDVEPPRSSLALAGTSIVYSHTITNVGNGPDTFILTATSLDGWPIRMVLDVNGDGTEDAGDTPIVGPLALNMDVSAQVLVVLDIPAGTPTAAAAAAVTLTATSQFDTGVSDSITDDLEITLLASDVTPPDLVTSLVTGTVTASSVQLSWTAPGDDGATGTATTYDVRYSTSTITEANWPSATQASGEPSPQVAGSGETFTVVGLSQSTTYYFAIKTSDEVPNESVISNVPSLVTSDLTAPDPVSNMTTGTVTASSVQLSWTAPGDDGATGTATTYDVRYSTSTITEANWPSATQASGEPSPQVAGRGETFTVVGLSQSTTYYFAIKTSDEVPNESVISNVPSLVTSDLTAPDPVSNMTTGTVTASSVQLSWTAPGDDGATGTATTYDVRYSTSTITEANWPSATQASGEPSPQVAGSGETFTVVGLSQITTYYFAIKTSDEVPNESALSNVPSATTERPSLELRKTVDAASAIAGDILTYTITYQAAWLGANDLTIRDTIPAGLSYEAGTLRLGTNVLTDVSGDDEGYHDQTAGVLVVTVPAAAIQAEDSVSFQVRVVPVRTTTMIQNVAVASAGATVGTSNVSETVIVGPDLLLEKTVQGPNPARSGDDLVYSILLTNDGSAGLAQDAVVTDTVPAGLEIVDAGPGSTVDGNVVTWDLGDVNPGDQVEALLQVQVAGLIPDTLTVVNVANLSLGGEPHMTTSAPPVLLLGNAGDILALDLQGETLEAQLGEPVYLSFSVENQSEVTVSDVGVSIAIPNGLAWSESLEAVDSVQTQPGQVSLYLGSLASGGTVEGRAAFALVSALPGNMLISATAFGHVAAAAMSSPAPVAALISGAAPAGAAAAPPQGPASTGLDVRSAEALIFVGVRAGTPLETRTVIGKIWIDEDGNGRQDNGEQGVLGVSVWNEAGDVASSDSEGKLSFRNVRPGSHTFRVDRSTLPLALRVNPDRDDGFASLHLNGWASGRISFGLIPLGAKLVDFQIGTEDEAGGGELPVVTQVDLAAPDAVVTSVLVLEPHRAGWPDVAYPVPDGWVPLPGAARLGAAPVADPEIRLDRDGSPWMFWTLEGFREPLTVTLEPLGAVRSAELVTLPPLRSDEERALGCPRRDHQRPRG